MEEPNAMYVLNKNVGIEKNIVMNYGKKQSNTMSKTVVKFILSKLHQTVIELNVHYVSVWSESIV